LVKVLLIISFIFSDLKPLQVSHRHIRFRLLTSKLNESQAGWFPVLRFMKNVREIQILYREFIRVHCAKSYQNWAQFDKVIRKI